MKKRGMSAIVSTLIIILLVIVALGIIWVVIRNVIQGGVSQVELAQKCRDVDVTVQRIVAEAGAGGEWDDYAITLSRTSGGENSTGIKFVLSNETHYSVVTDFGYKLTRLATQRNDFSNLNVSNATQIEMTAYFENDQSGEDLCPNSITQEF